MSEETVVSVPIVSIVCRFVTEIRTRTHAHTQTRHTDTHTHTHTQSNTKKQKSLCHVYSMFSLGNRKRTIGRLRRWKSMTRRWPVRVRKRDPSPHLLFAHCFHAIVLFVVGKLGWLDGTRVMVINLPVAVPWNCCPR